VTGQAQCFARSQSGKRSHESPSAADGQGTGIPTEPRCLLPVVGAATSYLRKPVARYINVFLWGGSDLRWELEPLGSGTRLTLWHNIDRRFISWGAAGWHICFDVLERLLAGEPIGRIVGAEAMKFGGWQRLNAEYAKQLGVETPGWPPNGPKR
jgi:hypothetical protein